MLFTWRWRNKTQPLLKGMLAGFVATAVLSALMVVKSMMNLMPELDVIGMLSSMMGANSQVAWIAHFGLGTIVWGGLFSTFNTAIPENSEISKGIFFGLAAWFMMMLAVMPMAGKGLFGLNLGVMAPVMTGILHVIFGSVLGWVYGQLIGSAISSTSARPTV